MAFNLGFKFVFLHATQICKQRLARAGQRLSAPKAAILTEATCGESRPLDHVSDPINLQEPAPASHAAAPLKLRSILDRALHSLQQPVAGGHISGPPTAVGLAPRPPQRPAPPEAASKDPASDYVPGSTGAAGGSTSVVLGSSPGRKSGSERPSAVVSNGKGTVVSADGPPLEGSKGSSVGSHAVAGSCGSGSGGRGGGSGSGGRGDGDGNARADGSRGAASQTLTRSQDCGAEAEAADVVSDTPLRPRVMRLEDTGPGYTPEATAVSESLAVSEVDVVPATPTAFLGIPGSLTGPSPRGGPAQEVTPGSAAASGKLPVIEEHGWPGPCLPGRHRGGGPMTEEEGPSCSQLPSGTGWELHLPGRAEAVFACSSGSTIACLVSRPASGSPPSQPGSRHHRSERDAGEAPSPPPSSSSQWELMLMSSGLADGAELEEGPSPIGTQSLRQQPAALLLGRQLSLANTLHLHDVCRSGERRVGGIPGGDVSTVLLVACGVWAVGAADETAPAVPDSELGILALSFCHSSGACSSSCHLAAPLLSLCVVAVEPAGLVVAAGRSGRAHVWRLGQEAAAGPGGERSWLSEAPPEEDWSLPPATFKGLPVNEIVELRLVPGAQLQGSTSSGNRGGGGGRGGKCLVLGCSSDGTVVVWDVLGRQLLTAVHLPMCGISCIQPLPSPPAWEVGKGSRAPGLDRKAECGSKQPLLLLARLSDEAGGMRSSRQALAAAGEGEGGAVRGERVAPLALLLGGGSGGVEELPGPDLQLLLERVSSESEREGHHGGPHCASSAITSLAALDGLAAIGTSCGRVLLWDAVEGGLLSILDCGIGSGSGGSGADLDCGGSTGYGGSGADKSVSTMALVPYNSMGCDKALLVIGAARLLTVCLVGRKSE